MGDSESTSCVDGDGLMLAGNFSVSGRLNWIASHPFSMLNRFNKLAFRVLRAQQSTGLPSLLELEIFNDNKTSFGKSFFDARSTISIVIDFP